MSEPITRNEHNVYPSYPREPVSKSTGGDDIRADNQSTVFKIVNMVRSNTEFFIGLLMALLVIESAALFYDWRYKAQQSELQKQELKDFQTFVFDPIAQQVKSDHDLIQAYGLSKTVADNCKR